MPGKAIIITRNTGLAEVNLYIILLAGTQILWYIHI